MRGAEFRVICRRHVRKCDIAWLCKQLSPLYRPEAKVDGFIGDGERSIRWKNIMLPFHVYPFVSDSSLDEWSSSEDVIFVRNTFADMSLLHHSWSQRSTRKLFKLLQVIGVERTSLLKLTEAQYIQYRADHHMHYPGPSYADEIKKGAN